jgi:NAD(P)-dependent dehydrogenase (short-subunit alcohol dehydrogenase family)
MGRLTGKTALISGTGAGIGRAAAQVFAEEGAAVFGCDINPESAAERVERAPSRNRGSARTRWGLRPQTPGRTGLWENVPQGGTGWHDRRTGPHRTTKRVPGHPAARCSSAPASRLSAATTRSRSGPSPASRSASTAS